MDKSFELKPKPHSSLANFLWMNQSDKLFFIKTNILFAPPETVVPSTILISSTISTILIIFFFWFVNIAWISIYL